MTRINSTSRRAFTLMELLVVLGIIVLLIALIAGVGIAVLRGRESAANQQLLVSLDRALDEYHLRVGSFPPYDIRDYEFVPGADVVFGDSEYFQRFQNKDFPRRPDAAVFVKQALLVPEAAEIVRGISDRFLVLTVTDAGTADRKRNDVTPSIVDTWSNGSWSKPWDPTDEPHLIYFVHPENALAQALFGRCVNRRPYFMSSGPDGKYGFKAEDAPKGSGENDEQYRMRIEALVDDNLYSYKPEKPNTDPDFFTIHR